MRGGKQFRPIRFDQKSLSTQRRPSEGGTGGIYICLPKSFQRVSVHNRHAIHINLWRLHEVFLYLPLNNQGHILIKRLRWKELAINFDPDLLASVAKQVFVAGQLLDDMPTQLHSLIIYWIGEHFSHSGFFRQGAWAGELSLRAAHHPQEQRQSADRHQSFNCPSRMNFHGGMDLSLLRVVIF